MRKSLLQRNCYSISVSRDPRFSQCKIRKFSKVLYTVTKFDAAGRLFILPKLVKWKWFYIYIIVQWFFFIRIILCKNYWLFYSIVLHIKASYQRGTYLQRKPRELDSLRKPWLWPIPPQLLMIFDNHTLISNTNIFS